MQLGFLRAVYDAGGPYATLVAELQYDSENAAQEAAISARNRVEELVKAGAPESAARTVQSALEQVPHEGGHRGRVVVANAEGVLLDLVLAEPPSVPLTAWEEDPELLPALEVLDRRVPFILAVVDRVGADVLVSSPFDVAAEGRTVEGSDHHTTKVGAGHEAHGKFQRHVQNRWRENAEHVVQTVSTLAAAHAADLLVLAGEVRARAEVSAALDEGLRKLLREVDEGGRGEGSQPDLAVEAAERLAEAEATAARARLVEHAGTQLAHRGAVTDPVAVLETLEGGQVEALLIDGPRLTDLEQSPEAGPLSGRLLRAAVNTDAAVHVAADWLEQPVVAVLRWPLTEAAEGAG